MADATDRPGTCTGPAALGSRTRDLTLRASPRPAFVNGAARQLLAVPRRRSFAEQPVESGEQREIGFSHSDILLTTLANYGGGLASLYPWGRMADRIGSAPVFRVTAPGMAGLLLLLTGIDSNSPENLALLLFFFFAFAALTAGFGLGGYPGAVSTRPARSPGPHPGDLRGDYQRCSGPGSDRGRIFLDQTLSAAENRLGVYHGFFLGMAILQSLSFLPLRGFTRGSG
jgi:MFS family permease